ncbi:importin-4-like, partial [Notechis scutatus]|uniref:Importin-4-like n=1 Tax=Notechis scutatus TaxID=8663 RepID=A0A6J1W0J4_9SAUR
LQRPSCSTADKSFAVGIIAETVQGLERASSSFVLYLLPMLLGASHDEDQEVCSNAVFGLGVLVEHGREATFEHYPKILALLSNLISQKKDNRVIDNVCGAIARMIMTNPGGMPVEQVFPVLLRALPLREDFEEYKTVYRCITFIYENDPSQVGLCPTRKGQVLGAATVNFWGTRNRFHGGRFFHGAEEGTWFHADGDSLVYTGQVFCMPRRLPVHRPSGWIQPAGCLSLACVNGNIKGLACNTCASQNRPRRGPRRSPHGLFSASSVLQESWIGLDYNYVASSKYLI